MKKLILLLIPLILCTGCLSQENSPVHVDPITSVRGGSAYNLVCIDGVEYIVGYRKMAPHWKTDEYSLPYLIKCENKN